MDRKIIFVIQRDYFQTIYFFQRKFSARDRKILRGRKPDRI